MTALERKQKNLEHIKKCASDFNTVKSIGNSIAVNDYIPAVFTVDNDCLSAALEVEKAKPATDSTITILNFASYSTPGGGFANGAFAQEESLCSVSNLYDILNAEEFEDYYKWNREHRDYGLYTNRAIWSPNVHFYRGDRFFNVITCAAPNYKVAIKNGIDEETIIKTYRWRLQFIYKILIEQHQSTLIAGAWGCGVFGFPLDKAIEIFKDVATIDTILAIPKSKKFNPQLGTKVTEY